MEKNQDKNHPDYSLGNTLGYTLGYKDEDFKRLREIAPHVFGADFKDPAEIRKILDWFGYLADWRDDYKIQSVRSSLHSEKITCIDSAVLSYGLLELLFPKVKRALLAIHRRDMHGEECGHCITLYWGPDGRIGAFSKSSFEGFGHRDATFSDTDAMATSFAEAYVKMKFVPLYYGVMTLEEAAPDLDWRFAQGDLNVLAQRLIDRYQYGFECG